MPSAVALGDRVLSLGFSTGAVIVQAFDDDRNRYARRPLPPPQIFKTFSVAVTYVSLFRDHVIVCSSDEELALRDFTRPVDDPWVRGRPFKSDSGISIRCVEVVHRTAFGPCLTVLGLDRQKRIWIRSVPWTEGVPTITT